jgi:8-oxo-dGTP diphosphatase
MCKKTCATMIFLSPRREVLLVLRDDRSDIPFPNCWDLPGGHAEEGETPEACIAREMREELGAVVQRPALFRQYDFADRHDFVFWQAADFDLDHIELAEGQRLRWFSEREIRALGVDGIAFGFGRVIADFFEERPFDRLGSEQ